MPTPITPIRLTDEDLERIKSLIDAQYGERVNTISGAVKFVLDVTATSLMPAETRRKRIPEIARRFKGDESRIAQLVEDMAAAHPQRRRAPHKKAIT